MYEGVYIFYECIYLIEEAIVGVGELSYSFFCGVAEPSFLGLCNKILEWENQMGFSFLLLFGQGLVV